MESFEARFAPSVPYKLSGAVIRRLSRQSVISRCNRAGTRRIVSDQALKVECRHCTTNHVDDGSAPDPRKRSGG
jgi:hypothetical protein